MRYVLITVFAIGLAIAAAAGFGYWRYAKLFPEPSHEVVQLTEAKRALLERLRNERKFQPNNYPPLGYTGAESPADEARAVAAVNDVIDAVLGRPDGPVKAETMSALIGTGMSKVDRLATEDRDRTQAYMVEIWYILGFKAATGRFAYGAYYQKPPGYGEPLPPGWTAPDQPRPIP